MQAVFDWQFIGF